MDTHQILEAISKTSGWLKFLTEMMDGDLTLSTERWGKLQTEASLKDKITAM